MKIVDFHAHIFPQKVEPQAVDFLSNYYSMPITHSAVFDKLMESAAEINVDKIVIHSTATKPSQVESINNFIASKLGDSRVVGFGTLHPDYPDIENEIDRIKSLGLRGIKFHSDFQDFDIDSKRMHRIYSYVDKSLPILMHLGDEVRDSSSPIRLANVMDEFPNITFIGAHLGGYLRWHEAEKCLFGRDVYLDTSSAVRCMDKKLAEHIIKSHGVDRILFGTDYPLAGHKEELELFLSLDLTPEEQEKILWKNAYKLLFPEQLVD